MKQSRVECGGWCEGPDIVLVVIKEELGHSHERDERDRAGASGNEEPRHGPTLGSQSLGRQGSGYDS